MLRLFEKYKKNIITWARGNSTLDWVVFSIWVVIAISIAVFVFLCVDKTPATEEDYAPLVSRAKIIQEKPIKMIEQNGRITINNEEIVLEFENSECKISAVYDRDFNLKEIKKRDKAHPVVLAILGASVIGFIVGFLVVSTISLIQLVFLTISYEVLELVHKLKRKRNN